jgi:hypothetical protein
MAPSMETPQANDRSLIAIMSAIIYASQMNNPRLVPSKENSARIAKDLLAEVDRTLSSEPQAEG